MRIYRLFALLGLVSAPGLYAGQCPPSGYSLEDLSGIRESGFAVESDESRNALAVALADCVAYPDPAIRDGVAFEGIATWLRSGKLTAETVDALYRSLALQIRSESDENGFQQPFAALLLSEVARTDRIEPTFSPERRSQLVELAANYLKGVRDYRGFSETEGWRHGVAHGSDLVLQLVLNPKIDSAQVKLLMAAVASQVAPAGAVFYHYGEPERLARAAFYAYRRGVLEDADWQGWFDTVSSAQPLENWAASFTSQAGLARRHNTLAFLLVMHLNAGTAGDKQGTVLDKMVLQAIQRVLGG